MSEPTIDLMIVLPFYLIPTWIALCRRADGTWWIILMNLFFGRDGVVLDHRPACRLQSACGRTLPLQRHPR
jgi:hypothetical protein